MLPSAFRFSFSSALKSFCFGLVGCSLAAAQTPGRFCLGGDLQHLSAAQRAACSGKLAAVRNAALRYNAPADWHFVMVCGEEGWKAYAPFSNRTATELARTSADTDLTGRSTYFREERLKDAGVTGASERIVAREMAAIVLGTNDETAIEARLDLWMRPDVAGSKPEAPVLRASR